MRVAAGGLGETMGGIAERSARIGLAAAWMLGLAAIFLVTRPQAAAAGPVPAPLAVAAGVPDQGRAWELITPEEPMGAVISAYKALAVDGNRIVYETRGPLPGSPSGDGQSYNMARRTDGGWVNEQVASPYPRRSISVPLDAPELYDRNLETSIGWSWIPGEEPWWLHEQGVFRGEPDGTFRLKARLRQEGASFIGASPDLRRSYFVDWEHLLPADAGRVNGNSVFELDEEEIHQLDVDNGGNLLFTCGADVPQGSGISNDGERVFIVPGYSCNGVGGVFLREAGTTTEISSPDCALADCGGEPSPRFVGATPDGGHAYLYAETRLTADDTDPGPGLYRYDVDSGQLTLLTGISGIAPTSAKATPSPDGSAVAFGATSESEGEGMAILDAHGARFLATPPGFMEWSADSRYLVFSTGLQLAPQDHDEQLDVYRYDSASGTFTEISAGAAGAGDGAFAAELGGGKEFPGLAWLYPSNPNRVMSTDGQRIFFGTAERLVPEDRNDAADVY
ncbi:MAG TPA: hypothetical protein VFP17_09775, partial [Solirubrobacterales bacterium]|nr:hypothetical protein [Solirubrobacterales bacterium]